VKSHGQSIANRSTEDLWAVGEASIRFDDVTNQSVSNTKQPLFPFQPLLFALPAKFATGSAYASGRQWQVGLQVALIAVVVLRQDTLIDQVMVDSVIEDITPPVSSLSFSKACVKHEGRNTSRVIPHILCPLGGRSNESNYLTTHQPLCTVHRDTEYY
jgi:hypothetical protein